MNDITKLFDLPVYTLITTGRTGTDYLQSSFDLHPEVLTFNGSLFFHEFWKNSICIINSNGNINLDDLIFDFIGVHLEKLKSRYDILERKDKLGNNFDQYLNIDLDKFRENIKILLKNKEINSRSFMIAVYASYGMIIGQDMKRIKIILHHIHHIHRLKPFLSDFPNAKIICMTRDPRANFVSGIENHRRYNIDTDYNGFVYFNINRILHDSTLLKKYSNEYLTIRLEDLGNKEIVIKLCKWLGVNYDLSIEQSTWGGLQWHGDRVSATTNNEKGFSKTMLQNKWESKLSFVDKYILNYIMHERLKHYNYSFKKIRFIDIFIIPLLIIKPISYELRFFSIHYLIRNLKKGNIKVLLSNIYYYLKRIILFNKFYLKTLKTEKYNEPLLK